jgi:membrane-associated phospholipid phosphatase
MGDLFSTQVNASLQSFSQLTGAMKALSLLGNEEFFLLLLPLVYLCIDRRRGWRLGLLLLLGDALNVCLKYALALPRPYWIDPSVRALSTDVSYGLPSSHAQNAAAIWPFLARRKALAWRIGVALLVAGIALSRVFLGVHFLIDVLAGVLLGVLFLALFLKIEPRATRAFAAQSVTRQIAIALAISALVIFAFALAQSLAPSRSSEEWARFADPNSGIKAIIGRAGALCGLIIGAALCARRGDFEADGGLGHRAARFGLAIVGVAFFWGALGAVAPREPMWAECLVRFARYALLAWWITDAVPRLSNRLNLRAPRVV